MNHRTVVAASLILGSLLVVGGGLALWKYRSLRGGGAAGFEPAQAVEVISARTATWRPTAQLVGTVIALRSINVSNEVAGTVREVTFESGSVVEEGQVLVTLDSSSEQADLAAGQASVRISEANVAEMEARIRLAESNVRRMSMATESKAASAADLDQAKADLDSSRALLDRSRAEVDQARARVGQTQTLIDKKTIRAPFKARVGLRNVHPGQYLAEGTQMVGLQGVSDKIYLDFAIPQDQISRVRPGDVVQATSAVLGGQPTRIEVVAIEPAANPETRNVRVRSIVSNEGERLRAGMFVDVVVPIGEASEYVVVPATAVRRASYGDHVYLVAPSANAGDQPGALRATQRFVKLGPVVGSDVIITEGLAVGDEIASIGSFKLRDGVLVTKGVASGGPEPARGVTAESTPPQLSPESNQGS